MKKYDDTFRNKKIRLIAGIDEAGRGPLAGPVVAAAVVFRPSTFIEGVNDSKKLSAAKREKLFVQITEHALAFAFEVIPPTAIDKINILQASLLAMKRSVEKLSVVPHLLLIDGNKTFPTAISKKAIVKGDAKSFSIAAASIIAKVVRDEIMVKLSTEFPQYKWEKNKGYGTAEHISAIKKYGAAKYHRKTFLKNILSGEQLAIFN
ncbi:MAG: ribonuclease HII [Ignavibacteria bacterium CG_4_8_14_3_um_filter_37_9]|nr:ribonuclease HII [Ignavibacteria bacterium]OIO16614.1 MAG: ribonuclease HII [Ignavibacteria bacterium CG1_02_37_35]PIP76196.1 MAG: ribonuclease HII [Ignavibacteria bacterium CG22_combo_CG10-13_8_21_14_all_37_15]PIS45939.1 MAG: ribonuclease HII [Ignavibacteria bacterium CG08_land_8_20_14_0_20_37_9]PIW98976.1 MAG: ribonuclease HII [Ignavibacteria bacterium CG_4_8_14_3_um_filter_37_9]PIX95311.1 MAG: ribonuclease HII [Ignavibacteria bacterium CG_4_10_14_3_um_filter_37_18]PJC59317.1 MAG: ribonu